MFRFNLIGTCSSFILLSAALATPAPAQWGGSLTLSSQARLRGQPISDHRPVAELELVHDESSGFYIGGSTALVATRDEGIKPLSFRQYAGFARRLSSATALDVGIVHSGYTDYSGIADGGSYTEAYVGLTGRHISGRLFLSPGYFRKDAPTLYAEVNGNLGLAPNWSLFAHAGRLTHLKDQPDYVATYGSANATDWRIGLRRRLGPVDLDVAWTGYVRDRSMDSPRYRKDGALLIALAFAF